MYKTINIPAILVLTTGLISPLSGANAQEDKALPHEVLEEFRYPIGYWRWEGMRFDSAGDVVGEDSGRMSEEVVVENHLSLHTSYNADGSVNKAFKFYNARENRFYLLDVQASGEYWILSSTPGKNIWTSQEKELPDGRRVIIRFTHLNYTEDSFEAIMEVSFDSGATWQRRARQYLWRTEEGFGDT